MYFVIFYNLSKDPRALVRLDNSDNCTEAYILYSDYFEVSFEVVEAERKLISFYLADYDMLGRVIRIDGYDLITNKQLYSSNNIHISEGVISYLKLALKVKGPDVTISGIFYD